MEQLPRRAARRERQRAGGQQAWLRPTRTYTETVDAILYSIYNNEDYLTKQGTETRNGRSCTKYSVSVEEFGYNYTVWVDNEFGFTMALEASAGSESLTYSMTPKLSNLVAGDLPEKYAAAAACNVYTDSL